MATFKLKEATDNLIQAMANSAQDIAAAAAKGVASGTQPGYVADSLKNYWNGGSAGGYTAPSYSTYTYTPTTTTTAKETVTMPTTVSELPTFDSQYMSKLNELANKLTSMNYDDWTQSDQYKSLASRYSDAGKMSMQDVLGQVASRTGGLASSYATSAAQQQYNDYMAKLEDVARSLYDDERSALSDNVTTLRALVNDEYSRYRDDVSDYYELMEAAQKAYGTGSSSSSSSGSSSASSSGSSSGSTTSSKTTYTGSTGSSSGSSSGSLSKAKTSLDFTPDEGIFTWNGKQYSSTNTMLNDIENAGLSEAEKNALEKKFKIYGFDLEF